MHITLLSCRRTEAASLVIRQNAKRILLCLLAAFSVSAQAGELRQDSGWWAQMETHTNLGHFNPALKNFRLWTTGEARFFDDFSHFSQGIVRIAPGYQIHDNVTLFLGYTWVPNRLGNGLDFDEHDINQAVSWAFKPDWGKFSGRTMLEWRFVTHDSEVAARLRQKFRADYPLPRIHPYLKLIGWEEMFFNLNSVAWGPSGGFDQNRAFLGLGWQLDRDAHYALELGYLNQFIHLTGKPNVMNHMLFTGVQFRF